MNTVWFVLMVPLLGTLFMLIYHKDKLTWWEGLLPMVCTIVFTFGAKFVFEKIEMQSTEYLGALTVKAEYYESYETWVNKTCSRKVRSGTDSKGNATYRTEYYDCSYCDYTSSSWNIVDNIGAKYSISQAEFLRLTKLWNSKPQFVDLNRHINYHGGCGKDGDKYVIQWDRNPLTSVPTTNSRSYENRIKAAHTSFDFIDLTEEDIIKYDLYEYPKIFHYDQNCVLGLDSVRWIKTGEKAYFTKMINYINGEIGPVKHGRIYFLFFVDKPSVVGRLQESFWSGGNGNEMIICVGISSTSRNLQWVYPFSWTPNRKLVIDIREDLMSIKEFNASKLFSITEKLMLSQWKRKDFKEFSYVSVEIPIWSKIVIWILSIIITVLTCHYAITNKFIADKLNFFKTKEQ